MKTYRVSVVIGEVEAEDVTLAYEKALSLKSEMLYDYRVIEVVRKSELRLEER